MAKYSGDPEQMLQFVVSDLGLHCLPVTILGVSRLQWVKYHYFHVYCKFLENSPENHVYKNNLFLFYACLKNETYCVTGSGVRLSVNVSFLANLDFFSYRLHQVKLKLDL